MNEEAAVVHVRGFKLGGFTLELDSNNKNNSNNNNNPQSLLGCRLMNSNHGNLNTNKNKNQAATIKILDDQQGAIVVAVDIRGDDGGN